MHPDGQRGEREKCLKHRSCLKLHGAGAGWLQPPVGAAKGDDKMDHGAMPGREKLRPTQRPQHCLGTGAPPSRYWRDSRASTVSSSGSQSKAQHGLSGEQSWQNQCRAPALPKQPLPQPDTPVVSWKRDLKRFHLPLEQEQGDAPTVRNLLLEAGALSTPFPAAARLPVILSDLIFTSFCKSFLGCCFSFYSVFNLLLFPSELEFVI